MKDRNIFAYTAPGSDFPDYLSINRRARTDRGERLKQELTAIAALIEAHRDEFEATINTNAQRQEWLEKKAALKQKPKPKPPSGPGIHSL